jgi:hypothetical protein
MEGVRFSGTSVNFCKVTWRHVSVNYILHEFFDVRLVGFRNIIGGLDLSSSRDFGVRETVAVDEVHA